jgi:hypothetical protein
MGSCGSTRNGFPKQADLTRRDVLALTALGFASGAPGIAWAAAAPTGQLTWAIHVSLAPTWFDPAETEALITPYMVLYALHDAMVKPMPGKTQTPCLAASWSASPDGLSYEFVLRKGVKFHNGEPVTADDVKFSFERYHGAAHQLMKDNVAAIEIPDPQDVRFKLKKPWPDFITFYSTASGSGWIVPKKYVEQVGDEGFKRAPIGAGPYKFVSFTPGVELVLEAFDDYWRKPPNVKRLVMKVIPDEATRLAALKRGEVDIAYSIRSELAEELRRTPGLALKPVVLQAPNWLYFPEQWEPKSPWHDLRVRQAGRLFGNHLEHQAFYTRGLAPILVERLEHQLHTRRERDEFVGAGADRRLFETIVSDLLDVFLGHDPAGPGRRGIKGQKIRPRRFEVEADVPRIGGLDRRHPILHQRVGGTAVPLEREFDVLRSDRLAVVEFCSLAQHEIIGAPVLGRRERLGETGRERLPGHRLHQRVVQRV